MIPYGRQYISQEDIDAVVSVLKSDFLTQGPMIEQFEQAVADYVGAKYAVATGNATQALHIACLAAELSAGDLLYTSPNTFVASANCARYIGADVDFVDINANTYNMDVDKLDAKLSTTKTLPKVVIPVHFAGQSCDMKAIKKLADQYKFAIIEDASHAIGGEYLNEKVGNCKYSDMTVFSFHPVKIITTGEGGMITTNSEDLYKKLLLLRSHGITRNASDLSSQSPGSWYYEQQLLGFNYRITDLQAALGYRQLQQIDDFIARRRTLVKRYNEKLAGLPLVTPYQAAYANPSWHLYVICLAGATLEDKAKVFEQLKGAGINVNLHYIPVHIQPYYRQLGFKLGDFPLSEEYYAKAITIPLYYSLSDEQQDYIIDTIKQILSKNTGV